MLFTIAWGLGLRRKLATSSAGFTWYPAFDAWCLRQQYVGCFSTYARKSNKQNRAHRSAAGEKRPSRNWC
jgi:hypothetical protein